jgi:hypothetical protein
MGYGLGKNTPVVLNFGKENYEALIHRHGQWIRWRTSTKCPCVVPETGQSDIHCKRCGGRGFIYGYQPKITVTQTVMADHSGIVEVAEEYADCTLNFVYDFNGIAFKNAVKTGNYITLNPESPIINGTYVYVVMIQDTVKKIAAALCERMGAGYYRVEGLQSRRTGIDGLYHSAPGDIVKIGKITDADGEEYSAGEFRTDLFLLGGPEPPGPLTAHNIEYIPPFIFALLNQELSKADTEAMIEIQGDAMLTFPYVCDVAEGDVLTVLSGTIIQKEISKRIEGADDTIGAFFVQEVVSCIGKERDYIQGVDFILTGTNRIRWIGEDAPDPGDIYSIIYKVNPTYVVVKSIPQLRTSENQRMPRKAIVKLYGSYSEKKKVNVQ